MVRLPPKLRPLFPLLKPAYTAATRLAAPTAQRLSRARGGWLPVGTVASLADAAATTGGTCVVARGAESLSRPPQLGLPAGLPLTDPSDSVHIGQIEAAELPGARVLGPHRAVITSRGDLVHDVSWYFGTSRPREHPLFLRPFPAAPRHIPGRLGVLASRGDANYYHFLFDVLPRIAVLEQAGIAPPERWYAPTGQSFQLEAFALLGIDADLIVDADAHPHVVADRLVVPGQPAMTEMNPPWVVQFLRERLLGAVEIPQEKRLVYVTRGPSAHNRTVVNEAAMLEILEAQGFESVNPGAMSVVEQIRAFATASVIVAPHGAALANLAFASPGALVIELFPAGGLLPDFWRLACGVPGVTYRYLSASEGRRSYGRGSLIVRDIEVDLDLLRSLLDAETTRQTP